MIRYGGSINGKELLSGIDIRELQELLMLDASVIKAAAAQGLPIQLKLMLERIEMESDTDAFIRKYGRTIYEEWSELNRRYATWK